MTISVRFVDGHELEVNADRDEWIEAFGQALPRGEVLEVRDDDGRRLGINSRAVLYWTLGDAEAAASSQDPAALDASDRRPQPGVS